jgi:phosphoribosylcarboxyaminoimidazole (NCAIR) mutase
MSESEAAGKLIKIPGMVEAAATKPVKSVGVPRLNEKGFRTGLLDIVELRIANSPVTQSIQNALLPNLFSVEDIGKPAQKLNFKDREQF